MLVRHAPTFRPASVSIVSAGNAGAVASGAPQSYLSLVRRDGNGANGFGYIYGQMPTGTINGPRYFYQDDGRLWFAAHSTTANQPGRSLAAGNFPGDGIWHWGAASWEGLSTFASIRIYISQSLTSPLAEGTYFDGNNGSGDGIGGPGELITIGNRQDSARTFNGAIGLLARWNRALRLDELERAKRYGPRAVPNGLILLYVNDQLVIGEGAAKGIKRTAITTTNAPGVWLPTEAKPRRFFAASGARIPVLSLPGVQNIATTTAQPKVTLTYS